MHDQTTTVTSHAASSRLRECVVAVAVGGDGEEWRDKRAEAGLVVASGKSHSALGTCRARPACPCRALFSRYPSLLPSGLPALLVSFSVWSAPNLLLSLSQSPAMAPTTTATPPGLQEATRNSTTNWQDDLQALFDHAKERFADVVWELQNEASAGAEEVWGHKGPLSSHRFL